MFHKLTAVGRISAPEFAVSQRGAAFLKFGLAVSVSKTETHWHNMIVSGKLAEALKPHLEKGQVLFIEGRPSMRKAEDGKVFHDVFVDTLKIVSGKSANGSEDLPF